MHEVWRQPSEAVFTLLPSNGGLCPTFRVPDSSWWRQPLYAPTWRHTYEVVTCAVKCGCGLFSKVSYSGSLVLTHVWCGRWSLVRAALVSWMPVVINDCGILDFPACCFAMQLPLLANTLPQCCPRATLEAESSWLLASKDLFAL